VSLHHNNVITAANQSLALQPKLEARFQRAGVESAEDLHQSLRSAEALDQLVGDLSEDDQALMKLALKDMLKAM
jgi:hypothetical protein